MDPIKEEALSNDDGDSVATRHPVYDDISMDDEESDARDVIAGAGRLYDVTLDAHVVSPDDNLMPLDLSLKKG